jgi:choline kinase
MKAIILAAGSGRRFKSIMGEVPKCILEINGETILSRLIRQIDSYGITDIKIVVGYQKERVIEEILKYPDINVTVICNDKYTEDVNIYSLTLALKEDISPCYIFEADCVYEDKCFSMIFDPKYEKESVWYSVGDFTEDQHGGIIGADESGVVYDINIVKAYEEKYKDYKKMVGVMKIGEDQMPLFSGYLIGNCSRSIDQYYHMPWIEHLDELKSYLVDFGDLRAESFNTVDAYYKVKEMFADEVS